MNSALPVRTLGGTAVGVTALGLGTAPLGNLYRTISDAAARETLDSAIERGSAISTLRLIMASASANCAWARRLAATPKSLFQPRRGGC